MNNNNPQTPPGQGQVPPHRLDEIQNELRALRDQNQQLRGQIDYMSQSSRQQAPQQQDNYKSPFDEQVDRALEQKFQRMIDAKLNPIATEFRNNLGYIVDKTDELGYKQQFGDDRFNKFQDKVQGLRQDYQARGQYISREEALRMVYFEETGKKATPTQTAPAPKTPVFDPHFGTMVDPDTRMPIQEGQTLQPLNENNSQQAPPQGTPNENYSQQQWLNQNNAAWDRSPSQHPGQMHNQQNMQQNMQQGPDGFSQQNNSNHPYQNPYGQRPNLPGQGVNQASPGNPEQRGHMTLDINSSDSDLAAFEQRYGDVPL